MLNFVDSSVGHNCIIGGVIDAPIRSYQNTSYQSSVELEESSGSLEIYPISVVDGLNNCDAMVNLWQQGEQTTSVGLANTHGTLEGYVAIANVGRGLLSSYRATALRGLNLPAEHFHPTLNNYDLSRAEGGIAAVADALSVASLTNEVVQLKDINAATEWVVSYPLAGYMNHKPYTTDLGHTTQWCDSFGVYPTTSAEPAASVQVNQQQGVTALQPQDTEYSPTRPAGLCHAVNVVGFGAEPVLADAGAENWVQAPRTLVDLLNGRASVLTWALPAERTQPRVPMLGFRLTTFENGTLDGGKVLANYSLLTPHKRD
ncbi:hypothetical protein [Neptunomonas marina]|nr:hypothetical protein [Neptunomonas marina]